MLQVAFLIAMPSPYRPQSWKPVCSEGTRPERGEYHGPGSMRNIDSRKDEDIPDVVFGVTEVPLVVREDDAARPVQMNGGREV